MRDTSDIFTVDGKAFSLAVTELKRTGEVTDTENSGRTNDYAMHRDIIGTFYNYKVKLQMVDYSEESIASYDALYELVTAPTPSHTVEFPYGQSYITFDAYITKAEDTLRMFRRKDGREIPTGTADRLGPNAEYVNLWGSEGLELSFIAMKPQRRKV